MDKLGEMEMFVRVVEAGGFTEAARRAGVSKSAVSKQIAALERRLGARLLDRTTRRVNPTEIGLLYYDRAARVLADVEEADATAAAFQGEPQGELRVSAPHSFGLIRLAALAPEFLKRYPAVSMNLSLEDRFVELIAEGFDLAIRIGALEDSSLKARRIGSAAVKLVASPDYLQSRGAPDSVEALAEHSVLHYSLLASGKSWRLRGPRGEEKQIRADGALCVNNGSALLVAAEQGLGIALSPDFIADESLAAGRVVEVLPDAAPEPFGIWAITPPGRYPPPKTRAFVDFLAEALRRDARESAATAAE